MDPFWKVECPVAPLVHVPFTFDSLAAMPLDLPARVEVQLVVIVLDEPESVQ